MCYSGMWELGPEPTFHFLQESVSQHEKSGHMGKDNKGKTRRVKRKLEFFRRISLGQRESDEKGGDPRRILMLIEGEGKLHDSTGE